VRKRETGKEIGSSKENVPQALSRRNIFLVTTLETIHRKTNMNKGNSKRK